MRGSNGLHPVANLSERQKCEAHPTKRKWCDGDEAKAEADRRSTSKIPIGAYLCDSCGCYHLTKSVGGDSITLPDGKFSVGEFQALAPDHPVFATRSDPEPPIVPGDHKTRVRFARRWLELNPDAEPTTLEMCEVIGGCTPESLRKVMHHLGYRNTRGRSARWVKSSSEESIAGMSTTATSSEEPQEPEPDENPLATIGKPYEARDVSRETSQWIDLSADRVRHLAVGDLIEAYAAAGMVIRIQVGS